MPSAIEPTWQTFVFMAISVCLAFGHFIEANPRMHENLQYLTSFFGHVGEGRLLLAVHSAKKLLGLQGWSLP